MLNRLWLGMMIFAIGFGLIEGRVNEVASAVTHSATTAISIAIGISGMLIFWLGLFRVAEDAGLVQSLARLIRYPMSKLFPDVPPEHPAMGAMILNIAANLLGLNSAATPFGLKAMDYLSELNQRSTVASNAMCLFLAINTSSITLIPITTIAFLSQAGASHPSKIILTSLIATSCSTIAGVFAAKSLQRWSRFKVEAP
jgi:spore maturation protein A